jgi:hypothetical protein
LGVLLVLVGAACASQAAPARVGPARSEFAVLGNASPADSGAPTLRIEGQTITIRGIAVQLEGAGVYGDVDLSEPHTVRLTLYDSLPGRPVDDPLPPSRSARQVVYQARIGPLAPGPYDVWVGRFEPHGRLVEVAHEPLRIVVAPPGSGDAGH